MLDPILRPAKDRLLAPLARVVSPLPPSWITGGGLLLGLGAANAAFRGAWGLGLALWIGNRLLDGLDGLVARGRDEATDLGGLLDLLADFTVYAAIPIGLAANPTAPDAMPLAVCVLLGVFYVNAASWLVPSALLERHGRGARERGESTSITIPEGLISGTETLVFYALFFLLPGRQMQLVLLMAGLTALTVLQRLVWAFRSFGAADATGARGLAADAHGRGVGADDPVASGRHPIDSADLIEGSR